nr:MAG TPA: hypothetical protein [Caudoviricetes sp.]
MINFKNSIISNAYTNILFAMETTPFMRRR